MTTTINCKRCGAQLDTQFMHPGDQVLCAQCGTRTPVPESARTNPATASPQVPAQRDTAEDIAADVESEREPQIDETGLRMYIEGLRQQQNLSMGILGGALGALVGAVIWAGIVAITNYQIGLVAIAIGFLAGYGVRLLGKGFDKSFGIAGAIMALLGVAFGNVLSVVILISDTQSIPIFTVLGQLDSTIIADIMTSTFSVMDLLFYGIAVYEGYRFSFRQLSEDEIQRFVR